MIWVGGGMVNGIGHFLFVKLSFKTITDAYNDCHTRSKL